MNRFRFENKKKKNYFEGWYFRFTNNTTNENYALIFAMTKDKDNPHSFIQFYDGTKHTSKYYTFPLGDMKYDVLTNTVHIGKNTLSPKSCHFEDKDIIIDATVTDHISLVPYKNSDSAMGYLSKAPLECFQEVIYMNATANVIINEKGITHKFSGNSYMEKTFGTSFPTKWVWMQSNFGRESIFSFSVGLVPVLFLKIKGFFLIFQYNHKEYRFSSYNFSKIKVDQKDKDVIISIYKGKNKVILKAKTSHPVKLVGPSKRGKMNLEVFESINSTCTLEFYENNELILSDKYHNVGLELMYNKKT